MVIVKLALSGKIGMKKLGCLELLRLVADLINGVDEFVFGHTYSKFVNGDLRICLVLNDFGEEIWLRRDFLNGVAEPGFTIALASLRICWIMPYYETLYLGAAGVASRTKFHLMMSVFAFHVCPELVSQLWIAARTSRQRCPSLFLH